MLGIGLPELILIIVAALIIIGPDKFPEMARAFGKAYAEFRRASAELRRDIADTEHAVRAEIKSSMEQAAAVKDASAKEASAKDASAEAAPSKDPEKNEGVGDKATRV